MNTQRKCYTVDDFAPILKGEIALPNTEPVDPLRLLNNLASGGHSMTPKWGWALRNEGPSAGRKQWTQFFLTPAAVGGTNTFDGGGYAIIWSFDVPVTLRFAICKHEKVTGAGARPERGWHPGSCKHCGLDMSVDSGD